MTEAIRDRRPTEADGVYGGMVECWFQNRWCRYCVNSHYAQRNDVAWRPIDTTPPPEPEPDLLEFINDVEDLCERVQVFLDNQNHLPLNLSRSYSTVAGQVSAARIEAERLKEILALIGRGPLRGPCEEPLWEDWRDQLEEFLR